MAPVLPLGKQLLIITIFALYRGFILYRGWVLEVGIENPQRVVIKLFLRRAQPLFYFEVDEKHRRHVQKNLTFYVANDS